MAHDVFLSYSRKDSAMKDRVQKSLADAGLSVWTDANLTPGTPEWFQAIERAIDATRVLVVLLSPDAKQSEWVQKEIGYAKAWKKPIFPILVRGDEAESTPFQIFGTQYVDVRDNSRYSGEMGRLIDAIQQNRGGLSPPPPTTSTYTPSESRSTYPPVTKAPQSTHKSTLLPKPATSYRVVETRTNLREPSHWNPVDQIRLLYWYFFQPEQVDGLSRRKYFYRGLSNQPIMLVLLVLPLLIACFPVLSEQYRLIPAETGIVYTVSPPVWIIGSILLTVLVTLVIPTDVYEPYPYQIVLALGLPIVGVISSQVLIFSYLPVSLAGVGLSLLLLTLFSIVSLPPLHYVFKYDGSTFSLFLAYSMSVPLVAMAAGQSVYFAINLFTSLKDVSLLIHIVVALVVMVITVILQLIIVRFFVSRRGTPPHRIPLLILTLIAYAILIWIYLLGGWRVLGIGGAIPA
ncbi:MAG: TIR domain-containing protein [Anaerolinea sp.]|nr:TIR domain-containing protein [Anaerolinea sp.]